jgi:hypothetical protein
VKYIFLFAGSGDFVKAAIRLSDNAEKKLVLIGCTANKMELTSNELMAKANIFLDVNDEIIKSWTETSSTSARKSSQAALLNDDFKDKQPKKSILKNPSKNGDKPKRSVRFADADESNANQVKFPQTQETLDVSGTLERAEGEPELKIRLKNNYSSAISKLAIKFNKNPLGVIPRSITIDVEKPIRPGKKVIIHVPLEFDQEKESEDDMLEDAVLEAALKTPQEVVFFESVFSSFVFFDEENEFNREEFLPTWKGYGDPSQEFKDTNVEIPPYLEDLEALQLKVEEINLHVVNTSSSDKGSRLFCSVKLLETVVLAVLTIPPSSSGSIQIACRSESHKFARITGIGLRQFFQVLNNAENSNAEEKS